MRINDRKPIIVVQRVSVDIVSSVDANTRSMNPITNPIGSDRIRSNRQNPIGILVVDSLTDP